MLRPAVAADVEAVAAIWGGGWADGHLGNVPAVLIEHRRPADFLRLAAQRIDATTVAVADGEVVGFVTVHGDEVEQVYVAATARGTGAASALLRHAETVLALDADVAWLAVVAGNARARRFYEREGWHDAGSIAYAAEIDGGRFDVPCRRYERVVATIDTATEGKRP